MADPPLSYEAITAVEATLRGFLEPWLDAKAHGSSLASAIQTAATLAVRDAAPHIRAAERERFAAELLQLATELRKDHP